jgi:hypothetical protein
MLLLDEAHAAFINRAHRLASRAKKARWKRGQKNGAADEDETNQDNEIAFTTLAPTRDNGTPGIYYTRYLGYEFPRGRILELAAKDLDEGNTDSNNNPPCLNEVFKQCRSVRPFIDLDLKFKKADSDWLRRYAVFVLKTMLAVVDKDALSTVENPLEDVMVYITTTVDEEGAVRPQECEVLHCPFCKNSVEQHAAPRDDLWVCMACNAKWSAAEKHGKGDGGGLNPTLRLRAKGNHPAAIKIFDGPAMRHVQQMAGESSKRRPPLPNNVKTFKLGAHLRFTGVRIGKRDLAEFMRIVQSRSKAFDKRITPSQWDSAVDDAPGSQLNLRMVRMDKAVMCPVCKGRRANQFEGMDNNDICLECFGSGRQTRHKHYCVWDVYSNRFKEFASSPETSDGWGEALLERCRTDTRFVLRQCSIANVDGAPVISILPSETIPIEVSSETERGRQRSIPHQQFQWNQSTKMAKIPVDARRYEFIHELICSAESHYEGTYIPDGGAFYIDNHKSTMVVHIDGDGSTYCVNKANTNPDEPYHDTSRAYAVIRPKGLRFKCFCQKTAYGCDLWEGSAHHPLTRPAIQLLFPNTSEEDIDTAAVLERHSTRDLTPDSPFLQSFDQHHSAETRETCLRTLQNYLKILNRTSGACTVQEYQRPYDLTHFVHFYDEQGTTAPPPPRPLGTGGPRPSMFAISLMRRTKTTSAAAE